jgi:23S rRNA (pseudouridine1915-N3)-methyltransferase
MVKNMVNKIRIVAIGKVKESYLLEAIEEYTKRLAPFCKLEMIELKDKGLKEEAKMLERYLDTDTIILDVEGKRFSSEEFAKLVKDQEGTLTFIIGGADGIDDSIRKRVSTISLSKMTFTHEMCRLFLVEQIYRTYMINSNRKYHR